MEGLQRRLSAFVRSAKSLVYEDVQNLVRCVFRPDAQATLPSGVLIALFPQGRNLERSGIRAG